MNISVISPHAKRSGITTVASLLAMELSRRNKTVCLTNVSAKQQSLLDYFGEGGMNASGTRSSQLLNLVKADKVSGRDIESFCTKITKSLSLYLLNDDTLSAEDERIMAAFIAERFPFDYRVFDIDDYDFSSSAVRQVMSKSDCIILVLTQSLTDAKRYRVIQTKLKARLENMPYICVVNKYSDYVGTVKQLAAAMGIAKAGNWLTIRYNPYVQCFTDYDGLRGLFEHFEKRTSEVADVKGDIELLANRVVKMGKLAKTKEKQQMIKRVEQTMETERKISDSSPFAKRNRRIEQIRNEKDFVEESAKKEEL